VLYAALAAVLRDDDAMPALDLAGVEYLVDA